MSMTEPHDLTTITRVDTAFGTFDVAASDIVSFPAGVPGFEECRRFVLLSSAALAPLQCLQSVEGPSVSFLVIDPRRVQADYRCVLSDMDRRRLTASDDALLWLAVVTVEAEQTTVNLRAPVVIDSRHMVGYQLMPAGSLYPLRFPVPGIA
jgi:flagellar assembly factor FliW